MNKATRFLVLGVIIGISVTWLSGLLAVEAESSNGDVQFERGVYKQVVQREIAIGPAGTVVLHNQNGRVNVLAWDKPVVDLVARKHVRLSNGFWSSIWGGKGSGDAAAGAEWLDEIQVEVHEAPSEVKVETILPRSRSGVNRWVEYEVRVPRDVRLELRTSNGEVNVTAVQGDIDAGTSNGAVTIDEAGGAIHAKTSNGAIVCRDARGSVDLGSSNGRIVLSHVGSLTADTTITCTTSNGSINASLPESAGFELDARTSNGRIHSEFPLTVLAGKVDGARLAGTVGAGGPEVKLRTSNGSIDLNVE